MSHNKHFTHSKTKNMLKKKLHFSRIIFGVTTLSLKNAKQLVISKTITNFKFIQLSN